MIIKDLSIPAIERSIQDLRNEAMIARERERSQAIAAYRKEQLLDKTWVGDYVDIDDLPLSFSAITSKIVDRRSIAYRKAPERQYTGELPQSYIDASARKNVRMKVLERYTNLLGVNAMEVRLIGDELHYAIINQFRPFFLPNHPTVPVGIQYLIHESSETNSAIKEQIWVVWTATVEFPNGDKVLGKHFLVDGAGKELDARFQPESAPINPFDILPDVFSYAEEVIDDFWITGMQDVVNANRMIDINLSELNHLIRNQAFGQAVLTGDQITNELQIQTGYDKVVKVVGQNINFDVLQYNAKFNELIAAIKFQVELVGTNNGVNIQWAIQGNPASGFSLLIQNIALLEAREDDIDQWRDFERRLYKVEQVIWEKSGMGTLPDLVSVDFVEPQFPVNPSEKVAAQNDKLEKGLISLVDIYKEDNPDSGLKDEEIVEKIQENLETNRLTRTVTPASNVLTQILEGGTGALGGESRNAS